MATARNPLARFTDTAENGAGFLAEREAGFAKLTPLTERAAAWLHAHVDSEARFVGETLVLEMRYFPPLADAIIAAGFHLRARRAAELRVGVRAMPTPLRLLAAVLFIALPAPALAWGDEGHRVVALIARSYLAPAARAEVDALLAADTDPLTAHDMASEATWADGWRAAGHRGTASWHFVDLELDGPDLRSACFGLPAPARLASAGPPQDCVVDKVREFEAELAAPATAPAERLLALKYLLHFVGDLHQPLHDSDNHDRGGNCVLLLLGPMRTQNLHAFWDSTVVSGLGTDPAALAASLRARITPALAAAWRTGDAAAWAQEAYAVSKAFAYRVGSTPGCPADPSPIALPPGYEGAARSTAAVQLQRAGVRLAAVLNRALGGNRTSAG